MALVLHWLKREFGPAPTAAVGYSLGGNMLGCLLAEEGDRCPLDAAVIVSAPFMLEACSYHMDKGFSRVYQRYLLNLLKANVSTQAESVLRLAARRFTPAQRDAPHPGI